MKLYFFSRSFIYFLTVAQAETCKEEKIQKINMLLPKPDSIFIL